MEPAEKRKASENQVNSTKTVIDSVKKGGI